MTTRILTLDIERQSAIMQGVWDLRQKGYMRPDQILVPTRTISLAWKWYGEDGIGFSAEWNPYDDDGPAIRPVSYKDTGLLEDYHVGHANMTRIARDLLDRADYVVGWNSKPFDIPNLRVHMAEHGIEPPSPHIDLDLIKVSRSQFGFMSHKLSEAATHFGLGGKAESGGGLWDKLRWSHGSELASARKKMKVYNQRDVELTEQMFTKMLPWIPNINLYGEGDYVVTDGSENRCRRCNSTDIRWQGTRRANMWWYRRFQCRNCDGWGRGTKNYYSMGSASA